MWWRDNTKALIQRATGGHETVPHDWMSATGLRALLYGDPVQLWLKYGFGEKYGLVEDSKEYSFLEFIGEKGRQFEAAFVANLPVRAVQAMEEDVDVRQTNCVERTMDLMNNCAPVISKAGLIWAPEKVYGSADLLVLSTWWYREYPHLKPAKEEPPHYLVVDLKFTSRLTSSDKRKDLEAYSAQVRIYSYTLGQLQGYMPSRAYILTRDRLHDPIPIEVNYSLGDPLDSKLAAMRDQHIDIRVNGQNYTPWQDDIVKCNFANDSHESPWSTAKRTIGERFMPNGRPLEWLPRIGELQAAALVKQGYKSIEDILKCEPGQIDFQKIKGLKGKSADKLWAVLNANRSGRASDIPAALIPRKKNLELFCDFEYFSNINVDFEEDWPDLTGREMLFLAGAGHRDHDGQWIYRHFEADAETPEAEAKMVAELVSYFGDLGVFKSKPDSSVYCWSPAEIWQSTKAAKRTGIANLGKLPWVDLQKAAQSVYIGVPGAYDYGLKTIAQAVGTYDPSFAVEWPESLSDGLSAMVLGWRAYEGEKPLETKEMEILKDYLRVDVEALERVLAWMRCVAKPSVRTKRSSCWTDPANRSASSVPSFSEFHWYDVALL